MELRELENKCAKPITSPSIFADRLGEVADAGQSAEAALPPGTAHVNGRSGVGHEREGTRIPRAAHPKGPCCAEVGAPPKLNGDAGRLHYPRPTWTWGLHELTTLRLGLSLRE